MTRVKICGLTRESDIDAAVAAGADSLGFISGYVNSPRNLTPSRLEELIARVPPFVSTVVVTPLRNKDLERVLRLAPGYLQIYDDIKHSIRAPYRNVIQTVRPTEDSFSAVGNAVKLAKRSSAILFDTSLTSRYSRTRDDNKVGTTLKQSLAMARQVKQAIGKIPLILGGGLTESNVEHVIRYVRPYAVDVSSGVESSPGLKDKEKIFRFVRNAKKS